MDIARALSALSQHRPAFHSEADFQHALAWELQAADEDLDVRLEYRPFAEEPKSLDMLVRETGSTAAIELKHLTRALDVAINDERFVLKNQGAYDIATYDCMKDLMRLEQFLDAGVADVGYFIVLSNESVHWRQPRRLGAAYDAFRLTDGRTVSGMLEWGPTAGPGTTRGREGSLSLRGSYDLHWGDYSAVGPDAGGRFRALIVRIPPRTIAQTDGRCGEFSTGQPIQEAPMSDRRRSPAAPGPVETAIRGSLYEGQVLHTPSRSAPFKIGKVDSEGIVLLLGKGEWETRLSWECLEGVIPYVRKYGGIVDIGGRHETVGRVGTLDGYLKECVKVTTAGWVAVVLEHSGVVTVIRDRPARVKFVADR